MRYLAGVILGLGLLARGSQAAAAPPAEAARLFRECVVLVDAAKLQEAYACFGKVYALYPTPDVRFNLARLAEATERLVEAYESFRRCLAEPAGALSQDDLRDARASLQSLGKRLGFMRVVVEPAGPARISVGKHDRGVASARALPVMPGEHEVRVVAPGFRPWEGRVTVTAGQLHEVMARLEPLQPSAPASVPVRRRAASRPATLVDVWPNPSVPQRLGAERAHHGAPREPIGPAARVVATEPGRDVAPLRLEAPRPSSLRPLAWASIVIAAAAVGAGGGLYAYGCEATAPYRQCPVDPAVRHAAVGLFVAGAVAAATALVLWLVDRGHARRTRAARRLDASRLAWFGRLQ